MPLSKQTKENIAADFGSLASLNNMLELSFSCEASLSLGAAKLISAVNKIAINENFNMKSFIYNKLFPPSNYSRENQEQLKNGGASRADSMFVFKAVSSMSVPQFNLLQTLFL